MFTKPGRCRALSLLLGITLAASACGVSIGEDAEGVAADAVQEDGTTNGSPTSTTTSTPTSSTTAPTETSVSDLEEATEGGVEPVAGQADEPMDKAFCEASADYWIASNASSHIDQGRPGEVSMLYSLMESRLDEAISLAPSDELAEPALVAREHFTVVYAAVSEARFDLDAVENSSGYADLEPSLRTLIDIDELLGTYLVGPCGYSKEDLDAGAKSNAADIARLVDEVLADSSDNDGDVAADYIQHSDSTDRLQVEVPSGWQDTQSEPSANGSALTIAPDVSSYLTSWRADGLKMTVKDAPSPIDWRAPMYETNAASDCTLVSSEPYSDPLYVGWIDEYDNCGGGPASAVVIGATDEDFTVEILVEVQFDDIDTQTDNATLTRILETFKAR